MKTMLVKSLRITRFDIEGQLTVMNASILRQVVVFCYRYSTRNVIFYKINDRIGLTQDTIEYTHDRTRFTHDTIGLIYDRIG